jgi:hypothetical protein
VDSLLVVVWNNHTAPVATATAATTTPTTLDRIATLPAACLAAAADYGIVPVAEQHLFRRNVWRPNSRRRAMIPAFHTGELLMTRLMSGAVVIAVCAVVSLGVSAQQNQMSFFITSAGPGNGANLGGLAGADKHCQTLAAAAGAGNRTWRAYLSAAAAAGQPAVNARDRIGKGPWMNVKGVVVAKSVADLHSDANNLGGETSLTEKGAPVPGNQHDILTGSQADGTLQTGDAPCGNWTSAETTGGAMVGHHNKQGGGAAPMSWNAAHSSKGCSQQNLIATGGNGYFYCFAN